jgi:PAS domain S-box-containing protein
MVAVVLFAVAWSLLSGPAEADSLRVGIYQNSPKVFWGNGDKARGLFIDIFEEIARREGWDIEYVRGTWEDNLLQLETQELDLVLDVTYTAERARRYRFNKISVLESWLQVFTRNSTAMDSIRDLNNLRIAVLKGAVQEDYLDLEIKAKFNINFSLETYPDYAGTVEALRKGKADAIVASRFFYFSPQRGEDIHPTPVMFHPSPVYFAFPQNGDEKLLLTIDQHLSAMKNDPNSVYYRSLNHWLEITHPDYSAAKMRKMILAWALLAALALLVTLYLVLRIRIKNARLRQAGRELKEATGLLDAVFDVIPDVMGIQDSDRRIIRYNRAGYEYLKKGPAEAIGQRCYEIIDRNHPCPVCATTEALREKRPAKVEKYAEEIGAWLDVRAYPILDENGDVKYLIEHLRDITELKQKELALLEKNQALQMANQRLAQAERELRAADGELREQMAQLHSSREQLEASEKKYRSIFESTGTAMVLLDEDYTIALANAEFENLSGYRREEIEGKLKWTEFVSRPDLERMKEYHRKRRVDRSTAPRKYEFRFIDRVGRFRDIYLTVDMVAGTSQSMASLLDITKLKEAEELIKSALREKELLIKEVYHRVKNNLQVVSSLLSLEAEQVKDHRDRDIFSESQNRIRSMSLIHESLYKTSNLARVDFGAYVTSLAAGLVKTYGFSPDQVELAVDTDGIFLEVDQAIPCGLMVNEMISNSLKHGFKDVRGSGKKGLITVRLSLAGERTFRLEVADNGAGFIGTSGQPAEAETLGLQLITILAEQLGGKVVLQPGPGANYLVEFTAGG